MRELTALHFKEGSFLLSKKRDWVTHVCLTTEEASKALRFALSMTLGQGEHRDHRSGGKIRRRPIQVFHDTFNGKLSELAVHRWVRQETPDHRKISDLDFTIHALGTWDSGDLQISNHQFQIKSTKEYGNLMLLETADWDSNGNYRPNTANSTTKVAGIIFVRLRPELWKITDPTNFPNNFAELEKDILSVNWESNIAGFATKNDIEQIVKLRQILPKNARFQKSIIMDADNYYIQAGDLYEISLLEKYLNYLEKIDSQ